MELTRANEFYTRVKLMGKSCLRLPSPRETLEREREGKGSSFQPPIHSTQESHFIKLRLNSDSMSSQRNRQTLIGLDDIPAPTQ